jgi:uridine kinase
LATAENTVCIIEGDAFYAGGLKVRTATAEQRADACIDRSKLRAALENLKAGRSATFRPFDWDSFDGSLRQLAITVEPPEVVVVEGVYSAHPDFADLLDVKILLTASETVRHQRLVQREGTIGPWESQWHEAEDWYFANVVKPCHFDLVLE